MRRLNRRYGRSVLPDMNLTWTESTHESSYWTLADGKTTPWTPFGVSREGAAETPFTRTYHQSNVVDHGVKDAKGRAIGGYVLIEHYVPDDYGVEVQSTRDGKKFGAINVRGRMHVKTLEEAKALAVTKLAEQAKRFVKAAAKGEGRQFGNKS